MLSLGMLVVLGIFLSFLHVLYVIFRPGLRSVPGPWLAKITNLYRVGMVWRGRYSYEIVELHRRYGTFVRLGPNCVSIADQNYVEQIYSLRDSFPKSDWVKSSQTLFQGKVVPALMTTQDKEYHNALKKSVAGAYSVSTLLGYESYVEDIVRLFLQRLDEEFIQTGKQCPLDKWLQWYAYDVIGAITMSKPMGLLEQGRDVDDMLSEIAVEADYRAVGAVMPFIDWLCRKNALAVACFAPKTHKIMVRAKAMLEERLARPNTKDSPSQDFIARFLHAKEKHPDLLNDRNMLGFVGSNLQAGSDTTAIALRTVVYHVLKNPAVLAKLRAELDGPGVKHPVSFQQAFNDLPYLDAVIREALRIHPPFALQLERHVPAGGLELPNGSVLPMGTAVGMFGYTMHLDKGIYGDNAEYFNPERWLLQPGEDEEEHRERMKRMKNFDMSFGSGNRRCIGVHVAELQIYKVIPALMGLLEIQLSEPGTTWSTQHKFFALQSNIPVRIQWRAGHGLGDLQGGSDEKESSLPK